MPGNRVQDNYSKMDETEISGESTEREDDVQYIVDAVSKRTYLRGKFLGKGAHARVYLATDVTNASQRYYAMKVMNLESATEQEGRIVIHKPRSREVRLNQVMKEVDIHSLMRHENIVRLETYFQENSKFYMVMEHCEMNNLAQLMRTRGRLGEDDCRGFLKQLLDGLKHIHDRGIIHRDLKPANIYLTESMVLKIGDFGLADRVHSKSRGVCGTPNYISPEVLLEQGYTPAVDIWAVGCITYHMLCGKPPFEAESQVATYDLIRAHRFSSLPPSQAGAAVRHLINWMLAFLPEDRPTITFILNHAWMKRNRGDREYMSKHSTWLKSHKKRKEPLEIVSNTEACTESTIHVSVLSSDEMVDDERKPVVESQKRIVPFWKNILEKAKSHTKVLSYEDISNKPMFHHLRSKVYFAMSSKKKEPIKKVIEEVLSHSHSHSHTSGSVSIRNGRQNIPVFVSKWIDYSNKYGFGYQLTDGTTGVFFNDSSQISLDGTKNCVTWCNKCERTAYPIHSVPNHIQKKMILLRYFVEYMDNNLSSGVAEGYRHGARPKVPPLLKQWLRNDKVILFEITEGLIQINFFEDHYKLILYQDYYKNERQVFLVVINEEKKMRKYNLSKMGSKECPEDILTHLIYVHSLL